MPHSLRVLFLASEADPFVKIGGLGDVAGSLPPALKAVDASIDVRLVIPFHGAIQRQAYKLRTVGVFDVPSAGGAIRAEALFIELDGLPVYLIAGAPISPDAPVYSADPAQDGRKFTFFSLAALELARQMDWSPDVLHANDWHTAPAIYALARARGQDPGTSRRSQKTVPGDPFFQHTTTLLGLHNLPYLGIGTQDALTTFELPPARGSDLPGWAAHLPLPLGTLTADHIVAVSPNYAREILTPEFGSGLHDFLLSRASSISGILNGIDTLRWDPRSDPDLVVSYDAGRLDKRALNKTALQTEFGLAQDPRRPLFGVVSRLDYQKGVDLVPDALRQVSDQDCQLIVLGAGDPHLERAVYQLEVEFPDRVRAAIRFDSALSSRIFGGVDALLIPSRYEPCGLTQMIAMRYGCVPVARATGGLVDTITDYNDPGQSTGFLFETATSGGLAAALLRAIQVFEDRDAWLALQRRGMLQDFSWERSARLYLQLYQDLVQQTTKRTRTNAE